MPYLHFKITSYNWLIIMLLANKGLFLNLIIFFLKQEGWFVPENLFEIKY